MMDCFAPFSHIRVESLLNVPQVEINVRALPILRDSDRIHCTFGSYRSNARMVDGRISCRLPEQHLIPPTPAHQGTSRLTTQDTSCVCQTLNELFLSGYLFLKASHFLLDFNYIYLQFSLKYLMNNYYIKLINKVNY